MHQPDPIIINSSLCRTVTVGAITVEVNIFRCEDDKEWLLEVVNANGTSICWDDTFKTDADANAAFEEVASEEGIHTFLDDADNVVPFPRR